MQESRCERGTILTCGYLRFCSGADKGQCGCELWFQTGFEVLQAPGSACTFSEGSFLLLHSDPRRILLRYRQGGLSLTFASVHAPHRANEAHLIETWWDETRRLCRELSKGSLLILAGDFNACLGSILSPSVGCVAHELEDQAGSCVHQTARSLGLWVPCTFPEIHWGDSWTYRHKHGGQLTRIDFILLPLEWRSAVINSWTDPTIHAGQYCVDHVASVLDLCTQVLATPPRRCGAKRRPRIDERAIVQPENRAVVASILRAAPAVSWQTSAHAHAALLTQYLQDEFCKAFPSPKRGASHSFLQEGTHRLRRLLSAARIQLLRAAFQSWSSRDHGSHFAFALNSPWQRQAHRAAATIGFGIASLAASLRKACEADRAAYLEALAERVSTGMPGSAYAAARRLLGHRNRKPFAPAVLPTLRHADGSLCQTPCAVAARWRQHFSSLEAGCDVSEDELLKQAAVPKPNWPAPPGLHVVPTATDLASVLKGAPLGKAAGADGLPHGIGVACPVEMADCLHPLALKLCMRGVEPLGYKAGHLHKLYKGRGPHDACTSFRGILLLPCHAKILHKTLRPAVAGHYEQHALSFQLGGRKGMATGFATHALRGFVRGRLDKGQSVAVLYADIAAAYYCSVRELTASSGGCADFAAVCSGLRLAPEDLEALKQHVASGSAMDHDGADPWLQHLTTELNSHTWMTISGGGEGIIRTNRGTRPGSSWADVVFALLVRRVLRRRTELLPERQEPLLEWDGVLSFEPTQPDIAAAAPPLAFGDMVWADDLATPMVADDPTLLAAQAASEASALADAFAEHAMKLSFGPLKTAVVLALRGAGSRAARRSAFGRRSADADSGFPVLREHYPADFLPAVDSYRHLGSIQSFDGSMRREIQQRVGQAWGAFREGRRKLYKNKLVAPIRRSAMLTGLVVSKLLVGAGTWPPLQKGEYKMLRAALYGVFRAAFKLDDQHIHACSIRSLLSTSSPVALLHAARLRYAGQMVKHAPVHLWAITKGDRAYCELMLGSFDWLFERVGRTCGLPNPRSSWPSWLAVMQGRPGKYKGWIKRALALEQLVDRCAADHAELYKLCRALSGTPAAPSDDFVQALPV